MQFLDAKYYSELFRGHEESPGQFKAHCPAHDDKNPSLSITDKNGKTLFHCFSGCSQDDVLEAIKKITKIPNHENSSFKKTKVKNGSTKNDMSLRAKEYKCNLSNDTLDFLKKARAISIKTILDFDLGQKDNRLTIPIMNLDGQFEDIRLYLPPQLRQNKEPKILPDQGGDASPKLFPFQSFHWLEKLKSTPPEKLEDIESLGNLSPKNIPKFIIISEGELDTLTLNSHGYLAITNTCGAKTWSESFSKHIAKLNIPVVIIMDNDASGIAGAEIRADSLVNMNVRVKILKWPKDRPNGHDVTDEIIQFGINSLKKLISQSVIYSDIVYMNEVIAEDVKWLFHPFVAIQKTMIIEGEPGIGKSFLTLSLAALTSIGGSNPLNAQQKFQSGKVLLMSAEDGLADTIKPLLEKMTSNLKKIFAPKEIFTLDDKGFEILERLISREKPILVIIDPLMPFLATGKDSNKSSDMRPFFKSLKKIAEVHNCAIIVTRHLSKSMDQTGVSKGLGSIDISAAVRSILQVTNDKEDQTIKRVTHIKSNIAGKGKPFGYRIEKGLFTWVPDIMDLDESNTEIAKEIERATEFLTQALSNGSMSALEILKEATNIGISKSTLNRAKKKARVISRKVTSAGSICHWEWWIQNKSNAPKEQNIQDSQGLQEVLHSPIRHYCDPESYRNDEE